MIFVAKKLIIATLIEIKNGNIVALQAIGGGLSWGSLVLKIGKPS